MKFGKAKFGGDFKKRTYWKLKDGEAVYRILPPLGDLADSGRWSQFYNVHYGYKNSQGQMRVFQSPLVKNRKTNMVDVPDAALERIQTLKGKQEDAKKAGKTEAVKRIGELLQQYNLDNNHYVNAIDPQGNIGILKLRHRAKLALDATIKRLRDSGVEPLDPETGRFFVFRRSGNALETTFQVDVLKKKVNVEGYGELEQEVVHKIDEELIGRLTKEAAQLDKLYKRPTAEEVARIVKESDLDSGKSPAIDAIFDTKADTSPVNNDEGSNDGEEETSQSAPAQTVAQAETKVAPAQTAPKTESLSAPTVTKPAAPALEQSDEDFLKSLGL